jgi:ISXO2 transposase-like protein
MQTGSGQRITLACALLLSDLEAASRLSGLSDFRAKVFSNPRDHVPRFALGQSIRLRPPSTAAPLVLVLVAVEKRGKASGRVRMRVIPDFKAKTIIPFLAQNVSPGATIYTDGLKSFEDLPETGFKHIARAQLLRSELRKGAKSAVPLA